MQQNILEQIERSRSQIANGNSLSVNTFGNEDQVHFARTYGEIINDLESVSDTQSLHTNSRVLLPAGNHLRSSYPDNVSSAPNSWKESKFKDAIYSPVNESEALENSIYEINQLIKANNENLEGSLSKELNKSLNIIRKNLKVQQLISQKKCQLHSVETGTNFCAQRTELPSVDGKISLHEIKAHLKSIEHLEQAVSKTLKSKIQKFTKQKVKQSQKEGIFGKHIELRSPLERVNNLTSYHFQDSEFNLTLLAPSVEIGHSKRDSSRNHHHFPKVETLAIEHEKPLDLAPYSGTQISPIKISENESRARAAQQYKDETDYFGSGYLSTQHKPNDTMDSPEKRQNEPQPVKITQFKVNESAMLRRSKDGK